MINNHEIVFIFYLLLRLKKAFVVQKVEFIDFLY